MKRMGTFILLPHHLLQVIFFGETNLESPLQVYFLFYPSVVGVFVERPYEMFSLFQLQCIFLFRSFSLNVLFGFHLQNKMLIF